MKTPREFLLNHHAPANAKLDAVRERVIAAECGGESRNLTREARISGTTPDFWRALFWPSPWAWASLAMAWALTVTLNLAVSSGLDRAEVARSSTIPAAAVEMAWAEQRLLMSTFIETPPNQPVTPRRDPIRPRPRSERKTSWANA